MKKIKTPKKLEPPKEDTNKALYIETKSRTTDSYRSPEPYGEWRETNDSSVGNVSKTYRELDRWNFSEYKVPESVYNADTVYIVYVTYSTGDTFGSSSGNIAIAFITEDVKEAQLVQKAILDEDEAERESYWSSYKKNQPKPATPWSDTWLNHEKSPCKGYACWSGYFERIENVGITVKVVSL